MNDLYVVKSNANSQSSTWLTYQQLLTQLILPFLGNSFFFFFFGLQDFLSFSVPFASSSSFLQPLSSGVINTQSLNFFSLSVFLLQLHLVSLTEIPPISQQCLNVYILSETPLNARLILPIA